LHLPPSSFELIKFYYLIILITTIAAFLLPSFAVTVIITLPGTLPITFPDEFTVAILVFEDFQFKDLFEAFAGLNKAFTVILLLILSAFTVVKLMLLIFTNIAVILHASVEPFIEVAVIVAVPAALTVTMPLFDTEAILVFDDFQVTLPLALAGFTVAFNV
jgi:hypothetical protein